MRRKEPTWTCLTVQALRGQDDFMSRPMLRAATGANSNQLSAALIHLRKSRVADVVIEVDGRGWWFALPEESDARSRSVDERVPESAPRKQRRRKS